MTNRMTTAEKNELFGRPGAVKATVVTERLRHVPRRADGRVQVVLAHPLVADVFVEAFNAACDATPGWVPQRCDSQVIRHWRGWTPPRGWKPGDYGTSNHSWAAAWDIFATPADVSPPGGVWTPTDEMPGSFVAEFERRGFVWGGRWKRRDTPHIEVGEVPSGGSLGLNPADWLSSMLKQGDVGEAVRDLQLGLWLLGQRVEVTGVFDPATASAVREVQALAGVEVDGIVGPQTEAAMVALWPSGLELVELAYQVALNRRSDPQGREYWAGRIEAEGMLPFQFLRHFLAAIPPAAPTPPESDGGVVGDMAERSLGLVAEARANLQVVESDLNRILKEVR